MAYITAAATARKIASPTQQGSGLTIYLSEHANKRVTERLSCVVNAGTNMDKWAVTAIYQSIVNKTFTAEAPEMYYDDGINRADDACFYAVSELRTGFPVCLVFAISGREIIIVTVLWPLDKGGAREVRTHGQIGAVKRQQTRANNVGGKGRVRRQRAA